MTLRPLAALFAVLAVLTALLGTADRFEPVGPDLVTDGSFEAGMQHWSVRPRGSDVVAQEGAVRIAGPRSHAVQELEGGSPSFVRMSARIRYIDVVVPPWTQVRGPQLHLASRPDEGKWVWHPALHETVLEGSGEQVVSSDYEIWGTRPVWGVWLHFSGDSGHALVSEVSLRRLQWKGWWRGCFWLLVVGWSGAFGTALWPSVRRMTGSAAHAGVVLASLGILVGTLAPDAALDPIRSQMVSTMHAVAPKASPPVVAPSATAAVKKKSSPPGRASLARRNIDKIGHGSSFGLLALSALFAFSRVRPALVIAVLLALTPVSEALQGLTLMRTPRLQDVGFDAAGIALGVTLWWVICTITARARPDSSPSAGE